MVYLELWNIKNQNLIQTYTVKHFVKIVNGTIVSQYKLAAFPISWNKYHEAVAPEIGILCKKAIAREGTGDR